MNKGPVFSNKMGDKFFKPIFCGKQFLPESTSVTEENMNRLG